MSSVAIVSKVKRRLKYQRVIGRIKRDDRLTREFLTRELRNDSNCVDVGGNYGDFTRLFLEHAPQGSHITVEPIPALAADLRSKFPNVEVVECALADHEGTATFHWVVDDPGWSGLQLQEHPGTDVREIQVRLMRLADIAPERVDFIKIDVEGGELAVLRGSREVLRRDGPIVLFEHALTHARPFGTTPADVHAVLGTEGYAVFSLDGTGPHTVEAFARLCEQADAGGYGGSAQTNWIARPY